MEIRKFLKKEGPAYLFILPALLLFALFLLKPMVEGMLFSFFKIGLKEKSFVGFDNYIRMFREPLFWIALKNTLLFVLIVVPTKIILALGIALILSKHKHSIQSIFRGAFYLPAVSSGVAMTIVWWWIFSPLYGPLNYLLSLVGIPQIQWLGEPMWARQAVILVLLNWTTGLGIILYLTALINIPKQIYEAAEIDGAGSIQQFFNITLPLILPITLFILVTTTIGIFQVWQAIFILTAGGPIYSTTSIVLRVYQLGFQYYKFGQASAYAVILLLLMFSVAILQFKWLNKEIEL